MSCTICTDEIRPLHLFIVKPCFHTFCIDCIANYIKVKLNDNVLTIRCPDPECEIGFLDPESSKRSIPPYLFDRWGIALCEEALGQSKFYCPYNDCSALFFDDQEEEKPLGKKRGISWIFCMAIKPSNATRSKCPACKRNICIQCKARWHTAKKCEEYQKYKSTIEKKEEEDEEKLRKLAADEKWQKCPSCDIYVERIDGCKFMQCRCGFCFCYTCGTEMSRRTHFCTNCRG